MVAFWFVVFFSSLRVHSRPLTYQNFSQHPWSCEVLLSEPAVFTTALRYEKIIHSKVFVKLLNLRTIKREGWIIRGVPLDNVENVFIHTLKVLRAAEILSSWRPELNKEKLFAMILIHDLAEIIAPDVTPSDNIDPVVKTQMERDVLMQLVAEDPLVFHEILDLWEEFESNVSIEAQIAFQLDKLDGAIQAMRYEKLGYSPTNFYPYTRGKLSDPFLKSTFEAVLRNRFISKDPYNDYFEILRNKK